MSVVRLIHNAAQRSLSRMFPGFDMSPKHNHWQDYGYPETIVFGQLHRAYKRHSIARGLVDRTADKTWETSPWLMEFQPDARPKGNAGKAIGETKPELDLRKRLTALRFWQRVSDADRRGLVGKYGALIMRLGDGKPMHQPVDRVPGGVSGLVEFIPAWEAQLEVAEYETDIASPNYGNPRMYQFREAALGGDLKQVRSFRVHPDRVLIFSRDGTVFDDSALEPCFNDLLNLEKVAGASGEGFYKNARGNPVITIDAEKSISDLAEGLGVDPSAVADKLDDVVRDWVSGFDKSLMLQGMTATTLNTSLPQPKEHYEISLSACAAAFSMPVKILVGNQTGERASTEDARDWAKTCEARRVNELLPVLHDFLGRLQKWGTIPARDWFIDWPRLTDATEGERMDIAERMARVNQSSLGVGQIFTPEEIREVTGRDPVDDEADAIDETEGEAED